jgi:hypothetical protein
MPFVLKNFDTIEIPSDPTYLVKDLLPDIGLAVIFGPEKCGKSFWLFDVMMHVALGWPYRGHDVIQGPVCYCALEGGRGFAKRIVAFRQEFLPQDPDPVPFWLLDVRLDLVKEQTPLIAAIRTQLKGIKPAAVVIDTLNRAISGNENDSDVMSKFIAAADTIRDAFNCLVAIIHHTPLSGGRPRGHSSLAGADDCQISVEKNDTSGIVTCKVVHMKDEMSDLVLASKLKRTEIGTDSKGNPITSCTVETVELNPNANANANTNLPKTQRIALNTLEKVLANANDSIDVKTDSDLAKKGIPVGTRVCYSEIWRQAFYDAYPAPKQDTKKKALFRASLDLTTAGLIMFSGDYVWMPKKSGT